MRCQHENLSLDPQYPHKKPGVEAIPLTSCTGQQRQAYPRDLLAVVLVKDLVSVKWKELPSGFHLHTHTHTVHMHMCTVGHYFPTVKFRTGALVITDL